jgi:hypothetical protein
MIDTEGLPKIPGIRVASVIERLDLSWSELRARMLDFADAHGHALAALRAALDASDASIARAWCDSVAAGAAEIGADGLVDKLKALERALRTGQQFYEYLYDESEMEFSGLIKAIGRLASDGDEIRDVVNSLYDFDSLRATFTALQVKLRTPDWESVDKPLGKLRELGIPPDELEGFRELEKLVGDRRAEDALDMAGILKLNLE